MVLRTNLTYRAGFEDWEPMEIDDRQSSTHLRVATTFYICVAPCCEDFPWNSAITVYWAKVATVYNEQTGC